MRRTGGRHRKRGHVPKTPSSAISCTVRRVPCRGAPRAVTGRASSGTSTRPRDSTWNTRQCPPGHSCRQVGVDSVRRQASRRPRGAQAWAGTGRARQPVTETRRCVLTGTLLDSATRAAIVACPGRYPAGYIGHVGVGTSPRLCLLRPPALCAQRRTECGAREYVNVVVNTSPGLYMVCSPRPVL